VGSSAHDACRLAFGHAAHGTAAGAARTILPDPAPPPSLLLPPLPALLFDLDGTLIDSIDLLVESMEYAYADRAVRPPVDEWVAAIGTPLDAMLRRWAQDDDDVRTLRARYREFQFAHHDRMTRAYPGAVEAVRALHAAGHPLAVVTSKLAAGARRSLAFIGIEECFAAVVGIDATERHKPEPEPVWHALERLGSPPRSRTVFVGDSVHDMRAGNAAGVSTAAALWGPSTRDQLAPGTPTWWMHDFRDLPPIVAELAARAG
jgi:pyrophosphatase PpaX